MCVARALAGPDPGGVYLTLKRRLEAAVPVKLERSVDVLEQTTYPRDHHVPRPELSLAVSRFEDPSRHHRHLPISVNSRIRRSTCSIARYGGRECGHTYSHRSAMIRP